MRLLVQGPGANALFNEAKSSLLVYLMCRKRSTVSLLLHNPLCLNIWDLGSKALVAKSPRNDLIVKKICNEN